MATYAETINNLIEKNKLQLDTVSQEEVSKAISNRLRNLDSSTEYRWREDNNYEERAMLILTAICISRFYPNFDLDHLIPKASDGDNHIWNIFPVPSSLNRAKSDRECGRDEINEFIETASPQTMTFHNIPKGYKYTCAEAWVLNTFG